MGGRVGLLVGLLVGVSVGGLLVGAGLGGSSDSERPLRMSIVITLLSKGFSCKRRLNSLCPPV